MTSDLVALSWPLANLGDAMEALARRSGMLDNPVESLNPSGDFNGGSGEALGQWIEATASRLGIEAEPVVCPYAKAGDLVRSAAPAIIQLPLKGEKRFLAIVGRKRGRALVLAPDLRVHSVHATLIQSSLCSDIEAPLLDDVNRLLAEVGVAKRNQARARAAIFREQVGHIWIRDCWLLRLPPGAGVWRQARGAKLLGGLSTILLAHTVHYALVIISWWMLGGAVFGGRIESGWLAAWGLLLLTAVPFRMLAVWSQGVFAIRAGGLLKKRLLYGALLLEPEEIKHQGVGQMLGRVMESAALESMALSGGFLGLVALIELAISAAILGMGAGGLLHVLLLLGWVILTAVIARWHFGRRRRWTEARLGMTHDLIERMVGHRTRTVQEAREQWHEGEDQTLGRYVSQSGSMDRVATAQSALARGWLVAGVAGLVPAFISASCSPATLTMTIGGIILASRAFIKLAASLTSLMSVAIAWQQVSLLFHAASRQSKVAPAAVAGHSRGPEFEEGKPLIDASDVVFRYGDRGGPVLRGCSLKISSGDKLLLEGGSGGGKSTLASLISGLRTPESGLILLGGLDHTTVGADRWRRQVASAPQFHENHVMTGTLAFNLLMGRRWPPRPEDLEEAEAVCRRLGLGDLLDRMPSGLLQLVGETGWQLSHGERSRIYLARALLQEAELVILDESLAALDPESMRRCLLYVLGRTRTLLVIAHP